ncbi:MAG: DNA polymerase III subunit gamma/tau [Gammaproteobacteria bacterium]|nr:DNA polymerase III subunit gamma/tau [Gammaproteobacteria bacterium]
MSYLVLARKWRPKAFSDVVGQQHVLRALINGLDQNRLHHAFLFSGTRGVGKTTLARIFAKSLNCEQGVSSTPCGQCQSCIEVDSGRFVDLIEVDAASRTKVDDTRELLDNVQYAPSRGRYKVYLIDEVHMLSTSSFNALLKTLEEPPPHVKFLFATTDPQKLPVTILSRCLQFNLRRLDLQQISEHLALILQNEAISFEQNALINIARAADGSMRDALSLLDQAISFGAGNVTTAQIDQMLGSINQDQLYTLIEALLEQNGKTLLEQANELSVQGRDFNKALNDLLTLLQRINTLQLVPNVAFPEEFNYDKLAEFGQRSSPELIQLFYQIALNGKRDLAFAADPKSGFEMTLLRMLSFQPKIGETSTTTSSVTSSPVKPEAQKKTDIQPKAPINIDAVNAAEPASPQYLTESKQTAVETPSSDTINETNAINTVSESASQLTADNWLHTISQLKLTAFSRQLADNSAFVKCEDNHVTLHVTPELAHLATDKARERLENVLSKHLNQTIKVTLQESTEQATTTTLATARAEHAKSSQQHAVNSIHSDPAVDAIKQAFNARVIESTIKPLD